jgi:hypothetical protein
MQSVDRLVAAALLGLGHTLLAARLRRSTANRIGTLWLIPRLPGLPGFLVALTVARHSSRSP